MTYCQLLDGEVYNLALSYHNTCVESNLVTLKADNTVLK